MTKRRIVILAFIGLLLAGFAAWHYLPRLITGIAIAQLQGLGFSEVVIQQPQLSLSKSTVPAINLAYPAANGDIKIVIEGVSADYHLERLWKQRSLDTVAIEKVTVSLPEPVEETSDQPISSAIQIAILVIQALRADLPQAWHEQIPLDQLTIAKIDTQFTERSPLETMQLEVTREQSHVVANLDYGSRKRLSAKLQPNRWQLALSDIATEPATQLEVVVERLANALALKLTGGKQAALGWTETVDQLLAEYQLPEITTDLTLDDTKPELWQGVVNIALPLASSKEWRVANAESSLPFSANLTNDPPQLIFSDASLTAEQASEQEYTVSDLSLDFSSDVFLLEDSAEGQLTIASTASSLSSEDMEARQITLNGQLDFTADKAAAQWSFQPGWELLVDSFAQQDAFSAHNVSVSSKQALAGRLGFGLGMEKRSAGLVQNQDPTPGPLLTIQDPLVLDVVSPQIKTTEDSLAVEDWQLELKRMAFAYQSEAEFWQGIDTDFVIRLPEVSLDKLDQQWRFATDQTVSWSGAQIKARGEVTDLQRNIPVTINTSHNLASEKGSAQLSTKLDMAEDSRFQELWPDNPTPLQVVAGTADIDGRVDWSLANTTALWATANVALSDIGGAYDDFYFSGLNTDLEIALLPQMRTRKDQKIRVDIVDVGVPVQQLQALISIQPIDKQPLPEVLIKRFSADTLDGKIVIENQSFDLNSDRNSLDVQLDKINIDTLMAVYELEELEATGLVSGVMPVTITESGIRIDDGQLSSLEPGGVIRYLSDTKALEQNQYAGFVVQALKNFNYQIMQGETQYSEDGTLELSLRFRGNNPDYEQGRPIDLNINFQENLLKLFESLRYVNGLNDLIDKRVQQYYQRQAPDPSG